MKYFVKFSATLLLLLASVTALAYFFWYKPKFNNNTAHAAFVKKEKETSGKILGRLKLKAGNLALFAKQHGYNTQICFMVDMKMPSGKKRFFVYNLKNDSVELAGMVTHGSGKTNTSEIQFSNAEGSLCTSLGNYKIGNAYNGKFGLAYKLYGLDNSNSNALNRYVVLHSHECVPNEETAPFPICESWGCPTVAPAFLMELKTYIDKSEQPVLLSIFH